MFETTSVHRSGFFYLNTSFLMPISSANLQFLSDLRQNNNREWFQAHKPDFKKHEQEIKVFHQNVEKRMLAHDQIEGGRVYRIYRDVRFRKDKTPYKTYWAGNYRRATHYLRGGYYFQIEPGASFAAGGFFGPNSQDLLHLRKQISADPDSLWQVLNQASVRNTFGQLQGERLKTAPKGFDHENPAIDLLRHKQFILRHDFSDDEVLADNFDEVLSNVFQELRPFFDLMSELLTTDLNGESVTN